MGKEQPASLLAASRKARGISQEQAAKAAGVSRYTWFRYEHGYADPAYRGVDPWAVLERLGSGKPPRRRLTVGAGRALATRRKVARLTQRQLAEKIGVSASWVALAESGEAHTTRKRLRKIREVLPTARASTNAEEQEALWHLFEHQVAPAAIPLVREWVMGKNGLRPMGKTIRQIANREMARKNHQNSDSGFSVPLEPMPGDPDNMLSRDWIGRGLAPVVADDPRTVDPNRVANRFERRCPLEAYLRLCTLGGAAWDDYLSRAAERAGCLDRLSELVDLIQRTEEARRQSRLMQDVAMMAPNYGIPAWADRAPVGGGVPGEKFATAATVHNWHVAAVLREAGETVDWDEQTETYVWDRGNPFHVAAHPVFPTLARELMDEEV